MTHSNPDAVSSLPNRVLVRLGVGKEALKDGASGLVVEGAQLVGTFLFFALLSRRLGPTNYGSFAAMYSLIGISLALAHFGPGLSFLQHAMDAPLRVVAVRFFSIYLVLIGCAMVLVLGLSPLVLPRVPISTVVLFMVAELFGAALVQVSSTLRLIVHGYRATMPLQLIPVAIKVVAVVGLYVGNALTLRSYGIVYSIGCLATGLFAFWRVTSTLHVPRRLGPIQRNYVSTTLTISSAIWVFDLHNDGDKLTMSANDLGADVGLYSAAYRLVMLSQIPIKALVASSYRTFLDPAVGDYFRRALKYTMATAAYCTVAAAAIIAAAPIALPLVVGHGFSGAVSITRWLAPLMVVRGFSHFPLNALMGLGRARSRLLCIIVSATVAMTLYIILIPGLSWKGAVIGSYCSDAVLAVVAWSVLWRVRNKPRLVPITLPAEPDQSLQS